MLLLDIKPKAVKFIKSLPPKHQRQVKDSILALQENPTPHDSKKLVGYEQYYRTDIGEYRIIYRHEKNKIAVILVGKRNDDAVYRIMKRII